MEHETRTPTPTPPPTPPATPTPPPPATPPATPTPTPTPRQLTQERETRGEETGGQPFAGWMERARVVEIEQSPAGTLPPRVYGLCARHVEGRAEPTLQRVAEEVPADDPALVEALREAFARCPPGSWFAQVAPRPDNVAVNATGRTLYAAFASPEEMPAAPQVLLYFIRRRSNAAERETVTFVCKPSSGSPSPSDWAATPDAGAGIRSPVRANVILRAVVRHRAAMHPEIGAFELDAVGDPRARGVYLKAGFRGVDGEDDDEMVLLRTAVARSLVAEQRAEA